MGGIGLILRHREVQRKRIGKDNALKSHFSVRRFLNIVPAKSTLDHIGLELSCGDIALKHEIQLFVGSALHFGYPEPTPYQARYAQSTEEESQFPAEVSFVGVDEVGNSNGHDDTNQSLNCGGYGDSL
jgi:hypothetical protein